MQHDGGVTLSICGNGVEVDWISQDLLEVSTGDTLNFLRDEYMEIEDRCPGALATGSVAVSDPGL
jgi:hypothetical protein